MLDFDILPVSYPIFIVLGHLKRVFNWWQGFNWLLVSKMPLCEVVLKVKSKNRLIVAILLHEVIKNIGTNCCWVAKHEERWGCE